MSTILAVLAIFCVMTILVEFIPVLFTDNKKEWMKTSILCNVMTNPIVNTLFMILFLFVYNNFLLLFLLIVLEVAVVFFEAYVYERRLGESRKKCIRFSVAANVCSILAGFVLFYVLNVIDFGTSSHSYTLPNEWI